MYHYAQSACQEREHSSTIYIDVFLSGGRLQKFISMYLLISPPIVQIFMHFLICMYMYYLYIYIQIGNKIPIYLFIYQQPFYPKLIKWDILIFSSLFGFSSDCTTLVCVQYL